MNTHDIIRHIEEPLFILRTYLARAAYTMQDIDEDFFNIVNFDPDNKETWWMLATQYRRNAVRAGIVADALQHIKAAQLSLDRLEAALSADPIEKTPSNSEPAAKTDTPNIRKLAEHIVKSSPRSRATSATSAEKGGAKA